MATRRFDKADFDGIVDNLIEFLSSQDRFKDYNFEASGIRTIIELLAYNLQYKLFYLNQAETEAFIDTAQLRDSVVSIAKHLGYTPRTIRSSRAKISLVIDPSKNQSNVPPPEFIIVTTEDEFSASVDGKQYTFSPVQNRIAFLEFNSALGKEVYSIPSLELIEGKRLVHRWTVDTSLTRQRFVIPNDDVDETSLRVVVRDSANSTGQTIFNRHENIVDVSEDDPIYFLQESQGGQLELIFGDDVIGKALETGNIVEVSYVVSSGDVVYGANKFIATSGIQGFIGVTVTTLEAATNSFEAESIESVRKLAPLAYETQNRGVTASDYSTLLLKDIPDIEFLKVWGGEENSPPVYGVVFISAKPQGRNYYSTEEKESILETYVRPRSVISVESRFVDPDFIRLVIVTNVKFRGSVTTLEPSDIEDRVFSAIKNFEKIELQGFNSTFRFSRLVDYIDSADSSIHSSLTDLQLKYRIFPAFNDPQDYVINFSNVLDRGDATNGEASLNSSAFIVGGIRTYIQDDGQGNLEYYRIVNDKRVVVQQNVGIINYTTGEVCLYDFSVDSLPNGVTYVDITVVPASEDISSAQNQILLIEENDDVSIFVEEI